MKNYSFSFVTYKNKVKSLPGFIVFFVILIFIALIPVLFCLVLATGLVMMIASGVLGLVLPKRKIRKAEDFQIIEIMEEEKKLK